MSEARLCFKGAQVLVGLNGKPEERLKTVEPMLGSKSQTKAEPRAELRRPIAKSLSSDRRSEVFLVLITHGCFDACPANLFPPALVAELLKSESTGTTSRV